VVIDTQEERVDDDGSHHYILKCLGLYYFETLKPKAIDRLHRNDLRIGQDQESLDLHPLLLLVGKVILALPLLDFFVELVHDNRDEQIHNEECCEEDEKDEYY